MIPVTQVWILGQKEYQISKSNVFSRSKDAPSDVVSGTSDWHASAVGISASVRSDVCSITRYQVHSAHCYKYSSKAFKPVKKNRCENMLKLWNAIESMQFFASRFRLIYIPHVLPAFFNKIGFFVGLALKKLKLCCHFLSWKSSERRNNLSYISVTYPGSAGW